MFYGLGATAAILTVLISYNNPRAIFWVGLGSLKVLVCSLYVQIALPSVNPWMPDGLFVSLIASAVFCHILEKYRIFEWEFVLCRLVILSMFISAANFLGIPFVSDFYGPLTITLYASSFVLIFANSLLYAGVLSSNKIKRLNRVLKYIGCNSKQLQKERGWVERWF